MPTPTPQPDFTAVALCDIPLLDAEGTEIPLGSRVEQVAVNEAHGHYGPGCTTTATSSDGDDSSYMCAATTSGA